jgi:hypothetical protein
MYEFFGESFHYHLSSLCHSTCCHVTEENSFNRFIPKMKPKFSPNFRIVKTNPIRRHNHEENSFRFFCAVDSDNRCLNNCNIYNYGRQKLLSLFEFGLTAKCRDYVCSLFFETSIYSIKWTSLHVQWILLKIHIHSLILQPVWLLLFALHTFPPS